MKDEDRDVKPAAEPSESASAFERAASEGGGTGLAAELWDYLKQTKKWWLAPILIVLVTLGLLLMLSGSPLSPFVYTLF